MRDAARFLTFVVLSLVCSSVSADQFQTDEFIDDDLTGTSDETAWVKLPVGDGGGFIVGDFDGGSCAAELKDRDGLPEKIQTYTNDASMIPLVFGMGTGFEVRVACQGATSNMSVEVEIAPKQVNRAGRWKHRFEG